MSAAPASPGIVEWLVRGLCVLVLLGFGWVVYGYVFSNGMCCADDSYIAMAAKNLADGVGYATSYPIFGDAAIAQFDPAVSTGPTLVLPAAAAIAVFGNTPWAPGFAAATISALVLLLLILVVRGAANTTRALLLVAFWVFLLYCATAGPTFVQWYALLGEIPAALLTILGMAVLAKNPESRRWVFLGGLLLGLALTSKTLAVIVAVPAFGYLVARIVLGRGLRADRSWVLLAAAAGYLLPTALFECWKLIYFGPADYMANLRDWLTFFTTVGDGATTTVSAKLSAYWGYYSFPLYILLGSIAVVAVLLMVGRRPSAAALRLFGLTATAAVIALGYFALSAPNNPRYALIGTVVGLFAVACVVFSRAHRLLVVGLAVVLTVPFVPPLDRLREPVSAIATGGYSPGARVANLELTTRWLVDHQADRPFIGGWWATVDDLEYMMPNAVNFQSWQDVPPDQLAGRVLVRNRIWTDLVGSPDFSALEARCNVVLLDAQPYLVTQCPDQ